MQPVAGVVDRVLTYPWVGKIDRVAPWRVVFVGEVLSREVAQVIAVGPKMVVDDVQNDTQLVRVRGVNEEFERKWETVIARYREQIDAVVTPVACARKLGQRQQLHGIYAQRSQP